MAKLENSLKNMMLSLTVITVVVGALLGFVADFTKQPIADAQKAAQEEAIKAVAPDFDQLGTEKVEKSTNGEEAKVFPVLKGGKEVGCAVQAVTKNGFGGKVTVMVGFDVNKTITGYAVLEHAETPGLGSKMPDWFQKNGKGNVIGKNPASNNITVTKDGGEVDAITAATISSRAFCDAIAQAYSAISGVDAVSSATSQVKETAKECCEANTCCKADSTACADCPLKAEDKCCKGDKEACEQQCKAADCCKKECENKK